MGRQSLRPFLSILLFCFAISLLPAMAQADDHQPPATSAYVYVGSYLGRYPNFTDYISGYSVAADGSLQRLSGFPVNGPSGGLVAVRNFVFGFSVGNGNYVATYTRSSDGSLQETSAVNEDQYARQDYGMSIYALNPDRSGQTLTTVLSCGSCDSYIIPLTIKANGQLSFDSNLPPSQGAAKWTGEFYFAPDNRYAYTEFWQEGASAFRRNSDGTLTYVGGTAPAPPPASLFGADVCLPGDMASSVSTRYVGVAWWSGIYCSDGPAYEFATYTESPDGSLQLIPRSVFTPQVIEYGMAFDPSGQYLAIAGCTGQYYCTEGSLAALQIFKLQTNGTLAAVGNVQTVNTTDEFTGVQWDNAGHLYALGNAVYCSRNLCANDLYIYNFDGYSLTLAPGSPHLLSNVVGVAVLPAQ